MESLNSRKKDITKFFADIRQIINDKESKMIEEVDEKIKQNNEILQGKIEVITLQEQNI